MNARTNEYTISEDGNRITVAPKAGRHVGKRDVQTALATAFDLRASVRDDWDGMTAQERNALVQNVLILVLNAVIWLAQRELRRKAR